ncbi:hypothetical protein [Salinisphaera sp.]|uniref:hypothetical protein n=1 Tax=Salinisphaera sp. TaxID=1914330 RepID=UPI0025E4AEAE|nr:hypothetical protein [Salinisphaera sp.]
MLGLAFLLWAIVVFVTFMSLEKNFSFAGLAIALAFVDIGYLVLFGAPALFVLTSGRVKSAKKYLFDPIDLPEE